MNSLYQEYNVNIKQRELLLLNYYKLDKEFASLRVNLRQFASICANLDKHNENCDQERNISFICDDIY